MSNDDRDPDATTRGSSAPTDREGTDTTTPPDQSDARAELANVLEDLDGYGER